MLGKPLSVRWRERAEDVRRFAPAAAEAFLEAARDFDEWLKGQLLEPLSIEQAAAESGYSPRHLRRMIRDGKVPNAGTPGKPQILRRDLPKKPGYPAPSEPLARSAGRGSSWRVQVARAVVARE